MYRMHKRLVDYSAQKRQFFGGGGDNPFDPDPPTEPTEPTDPNPVEPQPVGPQPIEPISPTSSKYIFDFYL